MLPAALFCTLSLLTCLSYFDGRLFLFSLLFGYQYEKHTKDKTSTQGCLAAAQPYILCKNLLCSKVKVPEVARRVSCILFQLPLFHNWGGSHQTPMSRVFWWMPFIYLLPTRLIVIQDYFKLLQPMHPAWLRVAPEDSPEILHHCGFWNSVSKKSMAPTNK